MIGLLLPPMTHITRSPMLTARQVVIDHILGLPIDTRYWLIRVHRRIPPVVLPIVRIYTFVLFMLCQVEDAELGLVVKHVKVLILEIVVDQFGLDLLLAMGVGAKLFIRALRDRIRPVGAETFAVILRVVLLLDGRVGVGAVVPRWALLALLYVCAHVSGVKVAWPAAILLIMVIYAQLMVMLHCDITRRDFKHIQVQLLSLQKACTLITVEGVNLQLL